MGDLIEKQFEKLSKQIKNNLTRLLKKIGAYLKRLIFPLYFFPIKLITYSTYYSIKFYGKFFVAIIKIIISSIIYPFRSLKNFLKALFIVSIVVYMIASLFVIADYLRTQYGWYGKFLCSSGARRTIRNSVVRIVGGYSEGTGFFITPNKVLTNFHVIADEPSPKIIFSNGRFVTPVKIVGDKGVDLAVLITKERYNNFVLPLPDKIELRDNELLIATGYPLGTNLVGRASLLEGRFIDFRKSREAPIGYVQTSINLVEGMSGGPLVDQCGKVVGISTAGLSGLSLFIDGSRAKTVIPNFTDQNITKIKIDPSVSPEEAIKAFYTYLKARRMKDGFKLLSKEYLKNTNFKEWKNRFNDILDVEVYISKQYKNNSDTVFVKFSTKNWNDDEVKYHYYEGTWRTVFEGGVYKILKGNIKEVEKPEWDWFYE